MLGPPRRRENRVRPVGGREDQRHVAALEELARRGADVEALDLERVPLAAEQALAELVAHRPRLLDPGRGEDARVPGRERLRDRRGRPHEVDDDRHGRGRSLLRGKCDVDPHRVGNLASAPVRRGPVRCQARARSCAATAAASRPALGGHRPGLPPTSTSSTASLHESRSIRRAPGCRAGSRQAAPCTAHCRLPGRGTCPERARLCVRGDR